MVQVNRMTENLLDFKKINSMHGEDLVLAYREDVAKVALARLESMKLQPGDEIIMFNRTHYLKENHLGDINKIDKEPYMQECIITDIRQLQNCAQSVGWVQFINGMNMRTYFKDNWKKVLK